MQFLPLLLQTLGASGAQGAMQLPALLGGKPGALGNTPGGLLGGLRDGKPGMFSHMQPQSEGQAVEPMPQQPALDPNAWKQFAPQIQRRGFNQASPFASRFGRQY